MNDLGKVILRMKEIACERRLLVIVTAYAVWE
jgi:hypothetical protein